MAELGNLNFGCQNFFDFFDSLSVKHFEGLLVDASYELFLIPPPSPKWSSENCSNITQQRYQMLRRIYLGKYSSQSSDAISNSSFPISNLAYLFLLQVVTKKLKQNTNILIIDAIFSF